jgi:hypothetical protein
MDAATGLEPVRVESKSTVLPIRLHRIMLQI